mmetsp:Transcript_19371/g.22557  ORF Transcript_19371/g.22557 Transcript_19371/m.22557 type:complete len:109 (-) Transcript_19371:330-656(-)
MNFKTTMLVMNSGRKLEIWFMMFCSMGISFILFDLIGEWNKIGKLIRLMDYKIRYGMLIRGVTQSYLSLSLNAILSVYTISWSGEGVSYMMNLFALGGILAVIYIPVK